MDDCEKWSRKGATRDKDDKERAILSFLFLLTSRQRLTFRQGVPPSNPLRPRRTRLGSRSFLFIGAVHHLQAEAGLPDRAVLCRRAQ